MTADGAPEADRGASWFAWAVWAPMVAVPIAFVGRYGRNVPYLDDWDIVPLLTGDRPATLGAFWSQTNEHRAPLPGLVLFGLDRATGGDFRSGMMFNAIALGALGAATLAAARRLRGRSEYADAFFPLIWLHPGHCADLLWSSTIHHLISIALTVGLLLAVALGGPRGGGRGALAAGAILVAMPLCGALGLVFVPATAAWLAWVAGLRWRAGPGRSRGEALALGALVVATLAIVLFYLVGYRRPPQLQPSTGPSRSLSIAAQFLSVGLGAPSIHLWPASSIVVPALLTAAAAALGSAWRCRPGERPRILGLLAFLAGIVGEALSIGWARAGIGPMAGFETRYVTLATPVLCWAYVSWTLYGPRAVRNLLTTVLFALALVALWPNCQFGASYGREYAGRMDHFLRDMRAGTPPYLLIRRHPSLNFAVRSLTRYLPLLRRARLGEFRHLAKDPEFREIPLPLAPESSSGVTWQDGTARTSGPGASLTFALPRPTYVGGVRLKFRHANDLGTTASLNLSWTGPGAPPPGLPRTLTDNVIGTGDVEQVLWIGDAMDRLRIRPDVRPCTFRLSEVAILVPRPARPDGSGQSR